MEEIHYNLVQGKNNGEKSSWHRIGQAKKHGTGFWVRMDVMPIPNEDGQIWLQLYEREYADEVSQENVQGQKQKNVYKNSHGSKAK